MNDDLAIRVTGLGKRYRLGATTGGYGTLRDTLAELARRLGGQAAAVPEPAPFWALRDVSFEVRRGEVLGIIGRNGAGKSTLLKILARITAPTVGRAEIRGRVGSLLEVGTGFHPELTGRENIYLNGALLGMTRAEIKTKFDEIVAFSEIEKFLDTPVKRYSSGMYVRLAFAVAAHLEPEILLVDEVLAVGDAAFQKKCLGKMSDAAGGGRTVLFVSHNLGLIRELTPRALWLHDGQLRYEGDIGQAIERYLSHGLAAREAEVDLTDHPNRLPGMKKILRAVRCRRPDGSPAEDFSQDEEIVLDIEYDSPVVRLAGIGFHFRTFEGVRVGGFNSYMGAPPPYQLPPRGVVSFRMPARQFTPGAYLATVSLGSHPQALEDCVENAIGFHLHPADIYRTGYLLTKEDGVAALNVQMEIREVR